MKIVFVSNYFNHHQKPFSEEIYKKYGDDYTFIATGEMPEERRQLGYGMEKVPDYVKYSYLSRGDKKKCREFIYDADVVIAGSVPYGLLAKRIRHGKLIFRYSERLFKKGFKIKNILGIPRGHIFNPVYKPIYLLCASAYAASDYKKFGLFKGKSYKWGYFPEAKRYDLQQLFDEKKATSLLWCGRFIDWKKPDNAIEVAKRLKDAGYDFKLNMIGTGTMEDEIKQLIEENNLQDCVCLCGSMKPEQVREYMERAGIYLFTSNFQEGWGAVLNEAMNSGCAVVASHATGSVPYMMENGENGYIYQSDNIDDIYNKVKFLLDNPEEQKRIGENAYKTITQMWNAETAVKRFLSLCEEMSLKGKCDLFEKGPCSKADILENDWFEVGMYETVN